MIFFIWADLVISIKSRPGVTRKCCQTSWDIFFVIQIGLTICVNEFPLSWRKEVVNSQNPITKVPDKVIRHSEQMKTQGSIYCRSL